MSVQQSYAYRHPWQGIIVNVLLVSALLLLGFGLYAPIITLEKFYVFSNTVSMLSALQRLADEAEWGLVILLGTFSVVFPTLKIALLLIIWNFSSSDGKRHKRYLKWLAEYSKWSMLDVFVVALLVVSIKLGAVAEATTGVGIYAFALSVILTMIVSTWIGVHAKN